MARAQAFHEVQLDDDEMRVTLWRFAPGTETGWHVHGLRYLVVPVIGGPLTVEDGKGSRTYPIEGRDPTAPLFVCPVCLGA